MEETLPDKRILEKLTRKRKSASVGAICPKNEGGAKGLGCTTRTTGPSLRSSV
jgi:hypothetical protein